MTGISPERTNSQPDSLPHALHDEAQSGHWPRPPHDSELNQSPHPESGPISCKTGQGALCEDTALALSAIRSTLRHLKHSDRENAESVSFGDKLADKVSSYIGRWGFIAGISAATCAWMGANVALQKVMGWAPDPYPHPLANLHFAIVGALTGPVILMSQSRNEDKQRKTNEEYQHLRLLNAELALSKVEKSKVHDPAPAALRKHIETYNSLAPEKGEKSMLQKIVDRGSEYLCSWKPVIQTSALSAAWIIGNEVLRKMGLSTLDPYPYIFLNLALSGMSALTAPIVLMGHQQQVARIEKRDAWYHKLDQLTAEVNVYLNGSGHRKK